MTKPPVESTDEANTGLASADQTSNTMGAHAQHTYIRRRGRMTKAQARAMKLLVEEYRATPEELLEASRISATPLGIEIGFGMGQALFGWAEAKPDWQLYGIELYQPGIGSLVDNLHRQQLTNVRVIETPAQQVFAEALDMEYSAPEQMGFADEVRIFFPDPWPKTRHIKRRLIQPDFVNTLAQVVKLGGCVRLATDWSPYATWIRECFEISPFFTCESDSIRQANTPLGSDQPMVREHTKFEQRGERLGHDIHDLVYVLSQRNSATTLSK